MMVVTHEMSSPATCRTGDVPAPGRVEERGNPKGDLRPSQVGADLKQFISPSIDGRDSIILYFSTIDVFIRRDT